MLVRSDANNNRWYKFDDTDWLPSVTTVTGFVSFINKFGLRNWLKNNNKRDIHQKQKDGRSLGTDVHDAIEELVKNKVIDASSRSDQFKQYMWGFQNFWENYDVTIQQTEQATYSKALGIAGRFDATAVVDGEEYILDWKTSNYASKMKWKLQLTAYGIGLERNEGTKRKLAVVHLKPRKNKRYKGYKFIPLEYDIRGLRAAKTLWTREYGDEPRWPTQYPETFEID